MANHHVPKKILTHLNPEQRQVVLHQAGPLMVLAGAGSGKTRSITHRIAHLYASGLQPEEVLAITFTNKAAGEMRARTSALAGVESRWISTFHSFGARLLRRHISALQPYDARFSIYDADDCKRMIKEIMKRQNVDTSVISPAELMSAISRMKNAGTDADAGAAWYRERVVSEVYALYGAELKKRNAVDFDDLLLLVVRLFEQEPDLLARYQDQFRHVLIDEYQDTNGVQYRLTQLLAARHRNVCVTGDPDQSIYAWRGADIGNILNFERDYPDAIVIKLEQNYRSTRSILAAANSLIDHNVDRKPKRLWCEQGAGDPVRVYRFADEKEEGLEIAALIDKEHAAGRPFSDFAVIYRINSLSRAVEQAFVHRGVPYSIVGAVEFYQRREIKDALAYLQILANPRDDESLLRVINVPPRSLGRVSVEKLQLAASERQTTLAELILSADDFSWLSKRARASIQEFASLLRSLQDLASGSIRDLINFLLQATDYAQYVQKAMPDEAAERLENLSQLANAGAEYESGHDDATLIGFLEQTRLVNSVDRWDRSADRVCLMSLHAAKGLEFPVVILLGVEEGILPLTRQGDDGSADIEEERRLAYVGITRAEQALYLTHTASRMRFGTTAPSFPSRFISEIKKQPNDPVGATAADAAELSADAPAEHIELDEGTERSLLKRQRFDDLFDAPDDDETTRSQRRSASPWQLDDVGVDASPDEYETDSDDWDEEPFAVGTRVYHDDYGEGTVTRESRIGRRLSLTVEFDDAGKKQIVPSHALLRRIR